MYHLHRKPTLFRKYLTKKDRRMTNADGKVLNILIIREMLVTERRKGAWQVPRISSPTHMHEPDQGWKVESMQRQGFHAFQKSLLETRKDTARVGEIHIRAGVLPFEIFTSRMRLVSLPRPKTRLSAPLYSCSLVSTGLATPHALRDVLPP